MEKLVSLQSTTGRDCTTMSLEVDAICPSCGFGIDPVVVSGHILPHGPYIVETAGSREPFWMRAIVVLLCPHCQKFYVCTYEHSSAPMSNLDILYSDRTYPDASRAVEFQEKIRLLSPAFCEIYNEALAAELRKMLNIAGIGYRKALEFLVKDYLIHTSPEDAAAIKIEFLGASLNRIENQKVKTLAERAAWIGNDETHYTKKHDDFNVWHMKEFIDALLHYIECELSFESALSIERK